MTSLRHLPLARVTAAVLSIVLALMSVAVSAQDIHPLAQQLADKRIELEEIEFLRRSEQIAPAEYQERRVRALTQSRDISALIRRLSLDERAQAQRQSESLFQARIVPLRERWRQTLVEKQVKDRATDQARGVELTADANTAGKLQAARARQGELAQRGELSQTEFSRIDRELEQQVLVLQQKYDGYGASWGRRFSQTVSRVAKASADEMRIADRLADVRSQVGQDAHRAAALTLAMQRNRVFVSRQAMTLPEQQRLNVETQAQIADIQKTYESGSPDAADFRDRARRLVQIGSAAQSAEWDREAVASREAAAAVARRQTTKPSAPSAAPSPRSAPAAIATATTSRRLGKKASTTPSTRSGPSIAPDGLIRQPGVAPGTTLLTPSGLTSSAPILLLLLVGGAGAGAYVYRSRRTSRTLPPAPTIGRRAPATNERRVAHTAWTADPGMLAGLVLEQAIDRVEPLTRFDRSSLTQTGAETASVPVTATIRYRVAFQREDGAGHGSLPGGILAVAGQAGLNGHIDRLRAIGARDLSGRLQRWAETQPTLPGPPLGSADCFDEAPPVGYAYGCHACSGAGQVLCHGCRGSREFICFTCGGKGRRQCVYCFGGGSTQCNGCGGRGARTEYKTRMVWNSATNSNESQFYNEDVQCFNCGGKGRQDCSFCGSLGDTTCSGCSGRGLVRCMTCGGNGQVACADCHGTGSLYASARLECVVNSDLEVQSSTSIEESRAVFASLHDVASLNALAPVTRHRSNIGAATLETDYVASVPVTTLRLSAAGRSFEILGYGGEAIVHDYKNIVGSLLDGDLARLEQQLIAVSAFTLRTPLELEAALSVVLESEMNSGIYAAGGRMESLTEQGLAGAASPEYVGRAFRAIRRGLGWVYRQPALIASALTFGATMTIVLSDLFLEWGGQTPSLAPGFGVAAGLLSGYAYERYAFAQMAERFAGTVGERLVGLMKASRLVRNSRYARAGAAIAVALAWYVFLPTWK